MPLPTVLSAANRPIEATPVVSVDAAGRPAGAAASAVYLASNVTLAAGATSQPVTNLPAGTYIFGAQFSGTSPSLVLEYLGPDGTNYLTLATLTVSGSQGVVLGSNTTLRLRNSGANSITSLYAIVS